MTQQLELNGSNHGSAVDVALDIDPIARAVTLHGERYQFATEEEMELFLRTLWETAVSD